MRKHKECLIRLVKAFYIMLDFYGMYFDEYFLYYLEMIIL